VIVTESVHPFDGERFIKSLRSENIACALIPDTAVGFVIDTVDMVLVGGEAVVRNGGLINQVRMILKLTQRLERIKLPSCPNLPISHCMP
jgi:translation initiation factor 2B subunit (eIF-2B alpha/beta/delta family)